MHPSFSPLPQPLLRQLGQWQSPTALAQALVQAALLPAADQNSQSLAQHLCQNPAQQSCLSLNGLDVLLHRAPEVRSGEPAEPIWGLHSIGMNTGAASGAAWQGAWPQGLDPKTIRPAELVQLLAHEPDSAVLAPGMVCFDVDGHDGRRWGLLGLFEPASQRLLSLHLARVGDWLPVAPAQSPSITA